MQTAVVAGPVLFVTPVLSPTTSNKNINWLFSVLYLRTNISKWTVSVPRTIFRSEHQPLCWWAKQNPWAH